MSDLAPFKSVLRREENSLAKDLARGRASPFEIAVRRQAIRIMKETLRARPEDALAFNLLADAGHHADLLWFQDSLDRATRQLDHEVREPERYRRKIAEYEALKKSLKKEAGRVIPAIRGHEKILVASSAQEKELYDEIGHALMNAAEFHRFDSDFLKTPAKQA